MKAYVIYILTDYAYPVAISRNKKAVDEYIKKTKKKLGKMIQIWSDEIDVDMNVVEFECS